MAGIPLGRPIPQTVGQVIEFLRADFSGLREQGVMLWIEGGAHFGQYWISINTDARTDARFQSCSIYQLYKIAHFGLKGLI